MVSKASDDLPDPESPVMQTRAFRGSRTSMSLRLCSRAPWTISSSVAMAPCILASEHMFVQSSPDYGRRLAGTRLRMHETAKRAALATLVVGGVVVLALALWELRLLVALLFLAFIVAAAMRPTIDSLAQRGIPRAAGV